MPEASRLDSGRFWLPGRPDSHVGGWLDDAAGWPRVTLADPLTDALRESKRSTDTEGRTTITMVDADDDIDPDSFTVHGHLRNGPRRVTLVNATSDGRTVVLGGSVADQGEQRLRADYALLGGHVSGADTLYDRATLHLCDLDEWAHLPGVSATMATDGSHIKIKYQDPDQDRAQVPGLGEVVLATLVTMPKPTIRGAALRRTAELTLELNDPLTFDEIWQRFVAPTTMLLSLCADQKSDILSLALRPAGESTWLDVRHPLVGTTPEESRTQLVMSDILFPREIVSLAHLAEWLVQAPTVSPIPAIVAATHTGAQRTLAIQLLDLATAAEGLHRRLPEQPKPITPAQAKSARRTARDAVDPALRDRVNDALGHLDQATYAERLRVITDFAEASIPEILGDRELWEQRIKQVRNGFAHQVPTKSPTQEWQEYVVLLRSLRWVLITALLRLAGVDAALLSQRLRSYEPFRFQLRQARRWTPQLFPPPGPDPVQ